MNATVFFGVTRARVSRRIADSDPSTRGLLESYPHDQIHRATGGLIGSFSGDMAVPPSAAFDPIFSVHHTNIDWLWARWACMPAKTWGQLPPPSWFEEMPWYFDEAGGEMNEPRPKYFDHRALGIHFKYEDTNCTPLELPTAVAAAGNARSRASGVETKIADVELSITASPLRPTAVRPTIASIAIMARTLSDNAALVSGSQLGRLLA